MYQKRFLIDVILLLCFFSCSSMGASRPQIINQKFQCLAFFDSRRMTLLYGNRFEVGRDLFDYFSRFGPRFQKMVKDLRASDTWVDFGAGHANAQKDWLSFQSGHSYLIKDWYQQVNSRVSLIKSQWPRYKANIENIPQLLAVSFLKPNKYIEVNHSKFTYKEDDISKSSLSFLTKSARVMTDYFGNLSYTETFSSDIKKYLSHLDKEGSLFLSIDNHGNTVQTINGVITILDWLERQPGISVRRIWTKEMIDARPDLASEGLFWDGDSVEIRVTDLSAFLAAGNLSLTSYSSNGSGQPIRKFSDISEGPN